jgi:hypothetical protein
MVKQSAIAALALVAFSGVADAQGVLVWQRPAPVEHVIIASPPQPSPGDPGYGPALPVREPMPYQAQAMAPSTVCGTFNDEYGRVYNCRGDQVGGPLPPARYRVRGLGY